MYGFNRATCYESYESMKVSMESSMASQQTSEVKTCKDNLSRRDEMSAGSFSSHHRKLFQSDKRIPYKQSLFIMVIRL